jgi:hypothetical protein
VISRQDYGTPCRELPAFYRWLSLRPATDRNHRLG